MKRYKITGRDPDGRAVFKLTVEANTVYEAKCEAIRHMSQTPHDRVNLQLGGRLEAKQERLFPK